MPLVRIVRLQDMVDAAFYKRLRRHPLWMHAQFARGNTVRNAYDYYMLVCGPLSAERQVRGDGALSAFGTDGALVENPSTGNAAIA
jgi:hypothetical protein